jgi:Type I restriction enzyme R protein N terminus (HSDR_N)
MLNLLDYQSQLSVKTASGKRQVWDAYRKKWLVLTPEELVRQLCLCYLVDIGFSKNLMRTELGITVNGLQKRCDIVVFDRAAKPFLLVECKRANVEMTDAILYQALDYNLKLKVPFCLITNGLHTFLYALDYENNTWNACTVEQLGLV